VLSQIKNNLGREDLPSLKYQIEPVTVDTPEGPSGVSRFRFTGEESDRSVRDLLGDRGDTDGQSERDEVAEFIRAYLADRGGSAPAGEMLKAGKEAGIPERTLQNARHRAGARTQHAEFGGGWVWALTSQGAAKAPKAQRTESTAPSAPWVAPSGEAAQPSPNGDTSHAVPSLWRCNRCDRTTDHQRVATYPHSGCGGVFQAVEIDR